MVTRRGFFGGIAALFALKLKEEEIPVEVFPIEHDTVRTACRFDTPYLESGEVNENMKKFLIEEAKKTLEKRASLSGMAVERFLEKEFNYGDEYGVCAYLRLKN